MPSFQQEFFDILGNMGRNLKGQPLNLGGYAASGGGGGGPPGGFIGFLPQTKVSYDFSELESELVPLSGASLLDNLNHIRYRIADIESLSSGTGVDIYQDNVLVANDVADIDFHDFFVVTDEGLHSVSISLLASGVRSDTFYSGVYGESLTDQITGVGDHFDIDLPAYDDAVEVYLNGIRQSRSEYTIDGDGLGITTSFIPATTDTLLVDYMVAYDGFLHTHSQYALASGTFTMDQLQDLLDLKSDVGHTHLMSDITDLSDPLVVNQQIVFTIASSGAFTSGVKPLRIYAHDVNDGATISEVFVAFNTPPSGAEMRMNVLKNGSTIFSAPAYVVIPAGSYTASKTTGFIDDSFTKDDYFQIAVVQGNSRAADMTLHIRFNYEL